MSENNTHEETIKELSDELIARGARESEESQFSFNGKEATPERDRMVSGLKSLYHTPPPLNPDFAEIGTWELGRTLIFKAQSALDYVRIAYGEDDGLLDSYEIYHPEIAANMGCVAAVCGKESLRPEKGYSVLSVKN